MRRTALGLAVAVSLLVAAVASGGGTFSGTIQRAVVGGGAAAAAVVGWVTQILIGGTGYAEASAVFTTQDGGTITTTRASDRTCWPATDGGMHHLDAGNACVTFSDAGIASAGLEVYPAVTNLLIYSETMDAGWECSGMTVGQNVATATDPYGTHLLDDMYSSVSDSNQACLQLVPVTGDSVGPFTASGWVSTVDGGSGPLRLAGQCANGNISVSCACTMSGDAGCTPAINSGRCYGDSVAKPKAERLSITFWCDRAQTGVYSIVNGGKWQLGPTGLGRLAWGLNQLEQSHAPGPYCGETLTGSKTCAAEYHSVANPLYAQDPVPRWGIKATVRPTFSGDGGCLSQGILNLGATAGAVNSASLSFDTPSGKLVFRVYDSTGAARQVVSNAAPTNAEHSLAAYNDQGALAIWVDGAAVAATAYNDGGSGTITSQPQNMTLGSLGTGSQLFGNIHDIKVFDQGAPP